MSAQNPIDFLTIEGFRSIKKLDKLRLTNLNVLIGANGAGKSNFVAYFRMLSELVEGRLQVWVCSGQVKMAIYLCFSGRKSIYSFFHICNQMP